MRIFLDANILFSAAWSDGAVRQLLRLARAAGHECWIDAYVETEARRNLQVKSPGSLATFEALVGACRLAPFLPLSAGLDDALSVLPPDDRLVLAAAIRLRCGVLVTGDRRDFAPLFGKRVRGVAIHSPASFYRTELSGKR
ncbi:MAG: PIN domain-containing protein [Chromatiales bacterium]|nr:PIN domain-containing protein [Chromatiales bacterium]